MRKEMTVKQHVWLEVWREAYRAKVKLDSDYFPVQIHPGGEAGGL